MYIKKTCYCVVSSYNGDGCVERSKEEINALDLRIREFLRNEVTEGLHPVRQEWRRARMNAVAQ